MTTAQEQVLQSLSLVIDEPENENIQFNFDEYAKQITKFLYSEMPTPFVMAIHGEWGSGKTTLIKKIKSRLDNKIKNGSKENWETLEFDAWEYERTDIVSTLLQKIQNKYSEQNTEHVKNFGKAVGSFVLDAALRKTVGLTKDEAQQHFQEFFKQIETIKETTEKIVADGRLIIFVDDLDRCLVDNVLDMLEAIKMFLSVKNIVFVIAVDMEKIERAWELRYKSEQGKTEGRAHVEKLFQLKLSLPPKSEEDLQHYLDNMAGSFANTDIEFIIKNCPPNPRKIKRMLNLIYFILSGLIVPGTSEKEQNTNFEIYLPIVVSWASITLNHPFLAKIVKLSPSYLIQMALVCNDLEFLDDLKKRQDNLEQCKRGASNFVMKSGGGISNDHLNVSSIEGLEHIIKNDPAAFKTLKNFGGYFKLSMNTSLTNEDNMKKLYADLYEPVKYIISNAGLIGI